MAATRIEAGALTLMLVAAEGAGAGPVILGERFTLRKIVDKSQRGTVAFLFAAPEKWRDQTSVAWDYGNTSTPASLSMSVENPGNEEAFFMGPPLQLFALHPDGGYFRDGQTVGGLTKASPMGPGPTLRHFVERARGRAPNFKIVGLKDLPDLPAILKVKVASRQRGVGMKVTYDLNGKPVEEEFYAVHYSQEIPYDGPQGRTYQINWGLTAIHSFRAPAGTLAARRGVFASIVRSLRPNPVWVERLSGITAFLVEQFNQQLQAGYDQIAAAGRVSSQISANNDAMLSHIDQQLQASQAASARAAATHRSETARFDDYLRGVDTMNDPYYGTSQHSSTEANHWTDGYGSYRHSNDGSYDPNQAESGSWTRMTTAQ